MPVKNPSEISQIFDAISYSKGASVIRMLVHYLGEDTFKTGIRNYLQKHKYGNAATTDLWKALSDASGKPVQEMMAGWTGEMGYPVLTVAEAGANQISLKQNRYLNTGDVAADEDKFLWYVPLAVVGSNNDLLKGREGKASYTGNFFKMNGGQHGFYRVNYSPALLEKIREALGKPKALTSADRIGVISDAFALASAGYSKTSSALSLVSSYNLDDGYM